MRCPTRRILTRPPPAVVNAARRVLSEFRRYGHPAPLRGTQVRREYRTTCLQGRRRVGRYSGAPAFVAANNDANSKPPRISTCCT